MKIDMTTVPSHHILSIRDEVPFDGIATFLKPSFERIGKPIIYICDVS